MSEASPEAFRSRIGITSADDPTPDNYVRAVERCGGDVKILCNVPDSVDRDLDGLCGVLLTGGTDVDPVRYDAVPHPHTDKPDTLRDEYELRLVRRATDAGIPVLAVCRGLQIANIAWGGSLMQHLPDVLDGTVTHRDMERKFQTFPEHVVTLESGSMLTGLLAVMHFETNASHHQAVDRVGLGLRVVARTADGIVEALERPQSPAFWLAVQWHPERLLDADNGESATIFRAFIDAAAGTRKAF